MTSGGPAHRQGAVGRGVDQIVNSASSAVFSFGAVLLLNARDFGAVSLQLIAMSLVLGITRVAVHEAALFERGAHPPDAFVWHISAAGSGAATATFAMMAIIGMLTPGLGVGLVVTTSAVGAATVLVDAGRYRCFAARRSTAALVGDSLWLGSTGLGLVTVAFAPATITYAWLAAIYAGSGLIAAAVMFLTGRTPGQLRAPARALRAQSRFGGDFILQIVPAQFVLAVAPAVIGLQALGTYRAVVTIFQPLLTAATAIRLSVVGGSGTADQMERSLRSMTLVLGAVSIAYGGLVVLLSSSQIVSRGALVEVGTSLVVVYSIAELFRVTMQPTFDIARLRNHLRSLLQLRAIQAVVLVVGSLTLGAAFGVLGYAVARAVTYASAVPFRRRLVDPLPTIGNDQN